MPQGWPHLLRVCSDRAVRASHPSGRWRRRFRGLCIEPVVPTAKRLAAQLRDDNVYYGLVRTYEQIDATRAVKFVFLSFVGEGVAAMKKAKISTLKGTRVPQHPSKRATPSTARAGGRQPFIGIPSTRRWDLVSTHKGTRIPHHPSERATPSTARAGG